MSREYYEKKNNNKRIYLKVNYFLFKTQPCADCTFDGGDFNNGIL